jgi:predicted transcriptional regulator
MGLGSTTKKLQKVADMADDLYTKLNEQKEQLQELRNTVEETSDRVEGIDREQTEQRALLEAIAEERGLDTDAILTEAVIEDAEATVDEAVDSTADDAAPAESESQSPPETSD